MTVNPTLEHARQVKKIASNLTELTHGIMNMKGESDYCYGTPTYQHISSLNEKLISLHIYLDDVLDRLEWRHYVWTRLKKELGMAGCILLGIMIGVAFSLPHMIAH
jgi:hypothetical protein